MTAKFGRPGDPLVLTCIPHEDYITCEFVLATTSHSTLQNINDICANVEFDDSDGAPDDTSDFGFPESPPRSNVSHTSIFQEMQQSVLMANESSVPTTPRMKRTRYNDPQYG